MKRNDQSNAILLFLSSIIPLLLFLDFKRNITTSRAYNIVVCERRDWIPWCSRDPPNSVPMDTNVTANLYDETAGVSIFGCIV